MTLWGENNTMGEKITPWGKKRTPWTEKSNTMVKKPATHRPPDHLTFSGHPIEVSTRYATPSVDTGHTASHAPGHPLAAQPPGIWRTTLATRWGRKTPLGKEKTSLGKAKTPLGKKLTPLGKKLTPWRKK